MTLDLCKSRGIKIFSIRHKEKRWHFYFFSFPIFSRGERHKLFLLNLSFLVLLRRNIFKAVFILISQHRKPRCVCLILHNVILSDYFYPPVFAAIIKLTIGATSNTSNCDRYMEGCTERHPKRRAWMFFSLRMHLS